MRDWVWRTVVNFQRAGLRGQARCRPPSGNQMKEGCLLADGASSVFQSSSPKSHPFSICCNEYTVRCDRRISTAVSVQQRSPCGESRQESTMESCDSLLWAHVPERPGFFYPRSHTSVSCTVRRRYPDCSWKWIERIVPRRQISICPVSHSGS